MIDNVKVFVADIDNTLRGKGSSKPGPLTISAMQELHKRGIIVGIASGRPLWQEVQDHAKDWKLGFEFDFLIGMNGGEIYEEKTQHTNTYNLLTKEQLQKIVTEMDDAFHLNPFVYREGYELSYKMDAWLKMSGMRHHSKIEVCKDLSDLWQEETAKILYRTDSEEQGEHVEIFGRRFKEEGISCFRTSPELVELQSCSNSKGTAIKQYCSDHQISLSTVIAFGDAENDIEMLKEAGWAVCLKNGMENCKAAADDITKLTVDQDGVGHYLYDHIIDHCI